MDTTLCVGGSQNREKRLLALYYLSVRPHGTTRRPLDRYFNEI